MDETGFELRSWWSYLIRGLLALALGILLLVWPDSTLKVLILAFGIFALVLGLVETMGAIYLASKREQFGLLLVEGLIGIFIGGLLLANQETRSFTLEVVVILIGIWAVVLGFIEIVHAYEQPPGSGRGIMGFGGLLLMLLGILLLALPLETVYAFIIIISVFLIVDGLRDIVLTFYVPRAKKTD